MYKITVNDTKLQEAINNSDNIINNILDFFNINNVDITIKVLDYEKFKKEFYEYLGYEINKDTTGFIEDDKNTVVILKFNDYKYTNHNGESYMQYTKVALHELVHVIHSIACNHNYPSKELREGIAVYLSEQYDFKNHIGSGLYYEYGLKIYEYLNNHTKEDLLSMLNVETE